MSQDTIIGSNWDAKQRKKRARWFRWKKADDIQFQWLIEPRHRTKRTIANMKPKTPAKAPARKRTGPPTPPRSPQLNPETKAPVLTQQEWDNLFSKSLETAARAYPLHFNNEASMLSASVTAQMSHISQTKEHPLHGNPDLPFILFRTLAHHMGIRSGGPEPAPPLDPMRGGALVQLASGGPVMTSGGPHPDNSEAIQCNWFEPRSNVVQTQNFLRGALKLVPSGGAEGGAPVRVPDECDNGKAVTSHAPGRQPMTIQEIERRNKGQEAQETLAKLRASRGKLALLPTEVESAQAEATFSDAQRARFEERFAEQAPAKKGLLSESFAQLEKGLSDLHSILPIVQDRFQQVLQPSDSPGVEQVQPPPSTGIATVDRVAAAVSSVFCARNILSDFINRAVE